MSQLMLVNPRKRKTKRKTSKRKVARRTASKNVTVYANNPIKRRRRRSTSKRGLLKGLDIGGTIKGSAMSAMGAIGSDLIAANLPIPENYKTGQYKDLYRLAVAFGTGAAIEKGLKQKALGRKVIEGSATVIAHDYITQNFGAQLGLNGYDDALAENGLLGMHDDSGLLAYADLEAFDDTQFVGGFETNSAVKML